LHDDKQMLVCAMFQHPVLICPFRQRIVHPCLPAFTSRLEGIQNANIETNTDGRLRDCLHGTSTTSYWLGVSPLFIGKRACVRIIHRRRRDGDVFFRRWNQRSRFQLGHIVSPLAN